MRRTLAITLLSTALCACASGASGAAAASAARATSGVATGELESSAPSPLGEGRASTEASARVVVGSRRERVREAAAGYLQAVLDGEPERVGAAFADTVTQLDSNVRYWTAETATEHHRSAINNFDLSFLRTQLDQDGGGLVLRSSVEFRRLYPTGATAVQAGDWVVDLPFVSRSPYNSVARYLPFRLVFRFNGSAPRVVAVSPPAPLRM